MKYFLPKPTYRVFPSEPQELLTALANQLGNRPWHLTLRLSSRLRYNLEEQIYYRLLDP